MFSLRRPWSRSSRRRYRRAAGPFATDATRRPRCIRCKAVHVQSSDRDIHRRADPDRRFQGSTPFPACVPRPHVVCAFVACAGAGRAVHPSPPLSGATVTGRKTLPRCCAAARAVRKLQGVEYKLDRCAGRRENRRPGENRLEENAKVEVLVEPRKMRKGVLLTAVDRADR